MEGVEHPLPAGEEILQPFRQARYPLGEDLAVRRRVVEPEVASGRLRPDVEPAAYLVHASRDGVGPGDLSPAVRGGDRRRERRERLMARRPAYGPNLANSTICSWIGAPLPT